MTMLKAQTIREPGYHKDLGHGAVKGLFLQVTASQARGASAGERARSWIYRFVSPVTGKGRWMGLGPVDVVTLEEARAQATAARKMVKIEHKDPISERDRKDAAAAVEAARMKTFGQVAKEFLEDRRDEWKNAKHAAQWETSLTTETKAINDLPVKDIDTPLILKVLRPIWKTKTETASRIRGRIEAVLAYATVSQYRSGENPARWRGHLEHMLSHKAKITPVKHHKALPYADVPAFMTKLRENDSMSARALEFTILTAARTSETIEATWSEVDTTAKVWTIPPSRMKAGKEHRVPLSDHALATLESLRRESEFLFPGARPGKPLSNMAMLELVRGMIGDGVTVHGFRSAFRDWCRERSNFPREIAELALAHINRDKTEAAYARGDALNKRRKLMAAWASFCALPPAAESNGRVVSMRSVRS
jgi:integrase